MRYVFATVVLFATACGEDPVRPTSNCDAEKAEVRRLEGAPVLFTRNEGNGNFEEIWAYPDQWRNRTYTFRWGRDYTSCQVVRPGM